MCKALAHLPEKNPQNFAFYFKKFPTNIICFFFFLYLKQLGVENSYKTKKEKKKKKNLWSGYGYALTLFLT